MNRKRYPDDASQSKVGHLTDEIVSHQDVPGSQVSVHNVSVLQVRHALCHLTAHVDEMSRGEHQAFGS